MDVHFPLLAPPLDLEPKVATVRLTVPRRVDAATLRVRVALPGQEVTLVNNEAAIPPRPRR